MLQSSINHCRELITKGSKSFSLAARIFDAETRDAAFCLYGWCRHCDDEIDGSDLGMPKKIGKDAVEELKQQTQAAYAGKTMTHPVFIAFQHVVTKYRIPLTYPLDLLEGMAMDIRKDRYKTLDDLRLYCYRVAGTVGCMMSHIMGVKDEQAFKHACDMGIAMQLTNIARDVKDDWDMGRVYLPLAWLEEAGVPANDLMDFRYRDKLAAVVKRILMEAERHYQFGDAGLKFLPLRASLAVAAARRVYSEIGRCVLMRGSTAWDTRTVVPLGKKIYVMMKGLLRIPPRALQRGEES